MALQVPIRQITVYVEASTELWRSPCQSGLDRAVVYLPSLADRHIQRTTILEAISSAAISKNRQSSRRSPYSHSLSALAPAPPFLALSMESSSIRIPITTQNAWQRLECSRMTSFVPGVSRPELLLILASRTIRLRTCSAWCIAKCVSLEPMAVNSSLAAQSHQAHSSL